MQSHFCLSDSYPNGRIQCLCARGQDHPEHLFDVPVVERNEPMHLATDDERMMAHMGLSEDLESLVGPLSLALAMEFNSRVGSEEAWKKAARGVLIKLQAEAHPQFEDPKAPSKLTFTFKRVDEALANPRKEGSG